VVCWIFSALPLLALPLLARAVFAARGAVEAVVADSRVAGAGCIAVVAVVADSRVAGAGCIAVAAVVWAAAVVGALLAAARVAAQVLLLRAYGTQDRTLR